MAGKKRKPTPAQKEHAEYNRRARILKDSGFNVSFPLGRKGIPQQRGAVNRLFREHSKFLSPTGKKAPVKFFPTKTAAEKRQVRKMLSHQAITPKGFFLQVPKGVNPRSFKASVKDGYIREEIPGRQDDIIVDLDASEMAIDPQQHVRDVVAEWSEKIGRKPRYVHIIVNGFEGENENQPRSLRSFFHYWDIDFIPHLFEDDPDTENGEDMDPELAAEIFQLKLIFDPVRVAKSNAKKSSRKKGRIRRP